MLRVHSEGKPRKAALVPALTWEEERESWNKQVLRAGARAMVLRGGATGLTGRVHSAQGRVARALRATRWKPEMLSVSLHQHPPRS